MSKSSKLKKTLLDTEKQVRKISVKHNKDLWRAYNLVGKVIYTLVDLSSREPTNITESTSNRVSLTANMIQSYSLVEYLISSGSYWAASAVLRQHMETLARIIEYRTGNNKQDKKPPNVKNLPFNMTRNYGRLSQLCHTSGGEVLNDFSISEAGEGIASPVPIFREEWAEIYFSLHIAHMLSLAIEIFYLHKELYPDTELIDIDRDTMRIARILVKTGFWKDFKKSKS
ncbi:MAG: hypothetical protein LLG43_14620 [Deltaproteobacteria bacterium]|nr:hypothetical protein [Deltaproteobacteria bacterium]